VPYSAETRTLGIRRLRVDDDHLGRAQRLLLEASETVSEPRLALVVADHEQNGGVGAAIVTGYERALAEGIDVVCVMAADNQMDPADLLTLVEPVARGEVDYAKANRLVTGEAWKLIPRTRYLGNAILSLLTKVASGYWHVADSQTGYTATFRCTSMSFGKP